VRETGKLKIPAQRLNEFPAAIARRVARQMLTELPIADYPLPAGQGDEGRKNPSSLTHRPSCMVRHSVTFADIESVRRLARECQSGKRLPLRGGIEAQKEFEWLVICFPSGEKRERPATSRGFACQVRPPTQVAIPELGLELHFRLSDKCDANFPRQAYTGGVWLDANELRVPLIIRNFRPGDSVYPAGEARPLKIKEIFQRRRIPQEQRPFWPVLESEGKVIWTRGLELVRNLHSHPGSEGGSLMLIEERPLSGWSSGHKP
jgi:tRNA(Ile)-lysidine synthetase-like protein